MKANLVCKGGGVKGIAIVGALEYFESCGYEWVQCGGTSVGAIIAALSAAGYSARELKNLMYDLDFEKLSRRRLAKWHPSILADIVSMFLFKGVYTNEYIEQFLTECLKKKGKLTFGDISEEGVSSFKAIATDVTRQEVLILPDSLDAYNIDPMCFEIAKAVQMSISIPFYYCPMKLKDGKQTSFIVDGGIVSNFPIWLFDTQNRKKYPTIGLNLRSDKEEDTPFLTGPIAYFVDVIHMALYTNEEVYFDKQQGIKIVDIPTFGFKATDFHLSKAEKDRLYESGYETAKRFIEERRDRGCIGL